MLSTLTAANMPLNTLHTLPQFSGSTGNGCGKRSTLATARLSSLHKMEEELWCLASRYLPENLVCVRASQSRMTLNIDILL